MKEQSKVQDLLKGLKGLTSDQLAAQYNSLSRLVPFNLVACLLFTIALIIAHLLSPAERTLPEQAEAIVALKQGSGGQFAAITSRDSMDVRYVLRSGPSAKAWTESRFSLPTDTLLPGILSTLALSPGTQELLVAIFDSAASVLAIYYSDDDGQQITQVSSRYLDEVVGATVLNVFLEYDWDHDFGYYSIFVDDVIYPHGFFSIQDGEFADLDVGSMLLDGYSSQSNIANQAAQDVVQAQPSPKQESATAYDPGGTSREFDGPLAGFDPLGLAQGVLYMIDTREFEQINRIDIRTSPADLGYISPEDGSWEHLCVLESGGGIAFVYGDGTFQIMDSPDPPLLYGSDAPDPGNWHEAGLATDLTVVTDDDIWRYSFDNGNWTPTNLPLGSAKIVYTALNWEDGSGLVVAYDAGVHRLFLSSDGTSWGEVSLWRIEERFALAKWICWIATAIAFGFLVYIFWRRVAIERELDRRGEHEELTPLSLIADNPVDTDGLGIFESSKNALIKLIRNKDTQPPVTVAINGSWGSGKSSLMSMIRKELDEDTRNKKGRYLTIWFNVWHFESEKHLLTVFLTKMVDKFEDHFGIRYRFKLFFNKVRSLGFTAKFRFFFAVFMLAPFVLYLLNSMIPRSVGFDLTHVRGFRNLFNAVSVLITNFNFDNLVASSLWLPVTGIFLLLGLISLRRDLVPSGLSAFFRIFPVEELRKQNVEDNPGFRDQYKKEFWRLLEAVDKDVKIVVFIDDIDRVTGAKVKQLLEGINFVADTASKPDEVDQPFANMYFVFGMAMGEVVKNLGATLTKDSLLDDSEEKDSLGLRFIEKMIDLTVQTPAISSAKKERIKSLMSIDYDKVSESTH